MSECYLCGSHRSIPREGKVRDKPELSIRECQDCGLVYLTGDTGMDDAFYEDSGMHGEALPDIGQWLAENKADDQRRFEFLQNRLVGSRVMDFGCGVGGFLLKAQALATAAEGVELERRLKQHYQDNGLRVHSNLDDVGPDERYDLITAFHVVEHLPDPREMLERLSAHLEAGGQLVVEVPSSQDALLTLYRNEPFSEFTYWSCHLFLFSPDTLHELGRQAGLQVDYVKQVQRYPLSNHLHWLARGRPGGHKAWSMLDSQELEAAYASALAGLGLCDTLIAGFSKPTSA